MNWVNKNLSFRADLLITFLNGLVVIGGVFVLNGLIARTHGLDVLGEFLLVKRTLSSSVGILLIGMNIGLPNYLSKKYDKSFGDNVLFLYCIITIPLTLVFIASIFWLNVVGFNQNQFWIYVIFSLGISAQFITYALYRGYMSMIGANIVQLLGTAIIPIIIFATVINVFDAMLLIGATVFTIMIIGYLYRNKGISIKQINTNHSKVIINYGLKRLISYGAQFILLAGVPIYIAQTTNFQSVAYFNSSFSMVRLSLLIINPISMVLLPRISQKIAREKHDSVNEILKLFLKSGLIIGMMGTAYCFMNAPIILELWLGEASASGIAILRLTILVLPFYTFSGVARSPIDVATERGYNSLIYGIAALIMVLIIFIGNYFKFNMIGTALTSFLVSHLAASIGNYFVLRKLYSYKLFDTHLFRDSFVSVVIIIAIIQIVSYSGLKIISQFALINFILAILAFIMFKYIKTGWIADLKIKLYG